MQSWGKKKRKEGRREILFCYCCCYCRYSVLNMRRFLIENGAESLFGTIKIAVLPIAKVFTMCFLGFLMASKYVNILPASGRKLLNGVSFLIPQVFRFSFYSFSYTFSSLNSIHSMVSSSDFLNNLYFIKKITIG